MNANRDIDLKKFYTLQSHQDKIKFLLQFAILAPSTHNSQPWLFRIKKTVCEIHVNSGIKLIASDKTGRNLYISIGACLENLILAAEYFGVFSDVQLQTKKNGDIVCEVHFTNLDSSPSNLNTRRELFIKSIMERVTKRGFYLKKEVPKSIINTLEKLAHSERIKVNVLTTSEQLNRFTDITTRAISFGYSDRSFRKELSSWINNNLSKRVEGIPGYALNMPLLVSMLFPTLLRYINISRIVAKINKKSLSTMSGVCVVTTPTDTKRDWIEVGRVSQRALLMLTSKGLSTYITVAAVDINNYYLDVQKLLDTDWRPQFSFTFGYSTSVPKFPPRHPIEEKLI